MIQNLLIDFASTKSCTGLIAFDIGVNMSLAHLFRIFSAATDSAEKVKLSLPSCFAQYFCKLKTFREVKEGGREGHKHWKYVNY